MSDKDKFDAIEVRVSGFSSRDDAARIVRELVNLGFKLKEFGNGSLLNKGGEILTQIMFVRDLGREFLAGVYDIKMFDPELEIVTRQFGILRDWADLPTDDESA